MSTIKRRVEALEAKGGGDASGRCLIAFSDRPRPENPEGLPVILVNFVEADGQGGIRVVGPSQ